VTPVPTGVFSGQFLMALSPFKLPFLATYVLVGAVFGVLVIHPLYLMVFWWELTQFSETSPKLIEIWSSRLWLAVLPRHLDDAITYSLVGAVVGFAFGIFSRNYLRISEAYRSLRAEKAAPIPDLTQQGETDRV